MIKVNQGQVANAAARQGLSRPGANPPNPNDGDMGLRDLLGTCQPIKALNTTKTPIFLHQLGPRYWNQQSLQCSKSLLGGASRLCAWVGLHQVGQGLARTLDILEFKLTVCNRQNRLGRTQMVRVLGYERPEI